MNEKLIRDGYFDKLSIEGAKLRAITDPQELDEFHRLKHGEELEELTDAIESKDPDKIAEEAGDVIETIYSRAAIHGVDRAAIEKARRDKKKKLGGFKNGIVLISDD